MSNSKFANGKWDNFGNINSQPMIILTTIGKTGVGKSTLLNRLTGDTSEKGNKGPFKAQGGHQSVTKGVQSYKTTLNFGQKNLKCLNNIKCHLIDTPGLADTSGNDQDLINGVRTFFKETCHGVHVFLLCINVTNIRYDSHIQNVLRLLTNLFGKDFWKHVMIVFTRHDIVENKFIHGEEYNNCIKTFPMRIRKQFNLNHNVNTTGTGKYNFGKSIFDIITFAKNNSIFICKYMKSWEEAGGIGNSQQRRMNELKLLQQISNGKQDFENKMHKLKNKLQTTLQQHQKDKQDWRQQLSQLNNSNLLLQQMEQKHKQEIQKLQNQSNGKDNVDNNSVGEIFKAMLPVVASGISTLIFGPGVSAMGSCLIM